MKNILVTDANQRAALAVIRSLGKKGFTVFGVDEYKTTIGGKSKYCSNYFRITSPIEDPQKFIEELSRIVKNNSIGFLIPITDIANELILINKDRFSKFCVVPTDNYKLYEQISDKFNLLQVAQKLQIPIPDSIFINNKNEVFRLENKLQFPLVIKPGKSRRLTDGKWTFGSVKIIQNLQELESFLEKDPAANYPFIIQKKVNGQGVGYFVLVRNKIIIAEFSHLRIREKPPWGGVSVCCRSNSISPKLKEYSLRLIDYFAWDGVMMVEWKYDAESDQFYLMEINARFWGSLQLAIHSGVNFPVLLINSYLNKKEALPKTETFQNVEMHWILGELDHLLIKYKNQSQKYFLIPIIYHFLKNVFLKKYYDVLNWADIFPFLEELKQYLKNLRR